MKVEKAKLLNKSSMKKKFNRDGFIVLKNEIPKNLLYKIRKDWNKAFISKTSVNMNDGIKKLNKKNKSQLHQMCLDLPKSNNFLKVSDIVSKRYAQLYNKKTIFCLDISLLPRIPKDKRLIYNFHQENHYYPNNKNVLTVYFPIFFNANKKNGSMSALSGSHKIGKIKKIKAIGKKNGFTSFLPINIENIKKKYDEIIFEAKVGDVVYFHQNLLHKSNFNFTNNCRIIGQFRLSDNFKNFEKY